MAILSIRKYIRYTASWPTSSCYTWTDCPDSHVNECCSCQRDCHALPQRSYLCWTVLLSNKSDMTDHMLWLTSDASHRLYKIYLYVSTYCMLQNVGTPHHVNSTCEQLSAHVNITEKYLGIPVTLHGRETLSRTIREQYKQRVYWEPGYWDEYVNLWRRK
jgi:hypothetical protein